MFLMASILAAMLGEEQANPQSAGKSLRIPHEQQLNFDVVGTFIEVSFFGRVRKGVLEVEMRPLISERVPGIMTGLICLREECRSSTFRQGGWGFFARWDLFAPTQDLVSGYPTLSGTALDTGLIREENTRGIASPKSSFQPFGMQHP